MTAYAPTPAPASTPLETLAAQLRPELLPATALEQMFFDTIVRLSVCAAFLGRHIEADPEFLNPETPRRLRLLLSNDGKLRYAYEEYRRLKMARYIQLVDPEQAQRPLLAVVATHTTRAGFRAQRPAALNLAVTERVETVTRPVTPGRNATCPCGSGLKYKRCCGRAVSPCANKKAA